MKRKLSPPPTKPGSVHRRVPADQAIPTQHLGAPYISHYILYNVTFVRAGVSDEPAAVVGIYMGFMGIIIRTKGKTGVCFIGLWCVCVCIY